MRRTHFFFLRETSGPAQAWEQLVLGRKLAAKPCPVPACARPPRPKASSNSRAIQQDVPSALRHLLKPQGSEQQEPSSDCVSPESNKENCVSTSQQLACLSGTSAAFLPKVHSPSRQSSHSQHHFIIKRASPVRAPVCEKEPGCADRCVALAFIKPSSVKYKNVVDKSRSISSDLHLPQLVNELPRISARSWVVLDVNSGDALFGYKFAVKREVASLTKLMTLYTACRIIEQGRLNADKFECEVSENASSKVGTSAGLRLGDKLSLRDLLFGTSC